MDEKPPTPHELFREVLTKTNDWFTAIRAIRSQLRTGSSAGKTGLHSGPRHRQITGRTSGTVSDRYAAVFYWLMWPTVALSVLASALPSTAVTVAAGIGWLLLLAFAV